MKSGNIIGEGFDDYVEKQINIRQKKLSELDKTNESILVFNSSAPWIRLASSVNLTDEDSKVKEILGNNFSNYIGSELAKNFVLFGGVSTYSGNHTSGVARSNNSLNLNESYGFGGLNNGLVPLPGIESVNITSYNRGSLRKAEIKLRAYNTLQFYIIDILYMRVGYTALLEWGHSLYFNNNENYEKNNTFVTTPYTNLFSKNSLNPTTPNLNNIPQSKPTAASQLEIAIARQKILNPNNVTQYSIIEDIEKERELRSGNYDGFFGKITSFNWSLTPNGAYDINITMISIGDVIESLKTNISLNNEIINNETTDTKDTVEPAKNIASTLIDLGKQAIDSNNGEYKLTTIPEFNNIEKQLISITPKGKDEKPYYYIKLGILLQVIEQQLLIYNKQFGEKVPYIKIDNDFDRNIFLTVPYQFSSDYNICLIPTTVATDQNNGISLLQDKLGSQVRISENVYAGKLMHIHINMDIIPKILDQLIDEDGKVPILSFLETLMEEIQKALGNINKFTVTYDDITNTLKILDDNPIPYLKNITELNYQNKLTTFNINGVQYEKLGSFINSIDLKAEISNELATIIAVGAQASGNIVGANATAFSTWNKGLIDRIIPEKITAGEPGSNSNPYTTFINNVTLINNILLRLYNDFDWSSDEDINTLTQLYTDTLNYYMGYLAQNNQISPPGFIPFNLGLNMKGLSGMKLYQTFKVTENLLPPTYNKNLRFIIKNLDHSIDSNGWITKIQSLTTGADPSGSSYTPPQIIINSSTPAEENTGKSIEQVNTNAQERLTDTCPSGIPLISEGYKNIVEKIINYSLQRNQFKTQPKNIQKEWLIALLTLGYAEVRYNWSKSESFKYNSTDAVASIFGKKYYDNKTKIDPLFKNTPLDETKQKLLADSLYDNREGNGKNEGYKFRGRGLSQITFKNGYKSIENVLKTNGFPNIDLINNPDQLSSNIDISVASLVLSKIGTAKNDLPQNPDKSYSTDAGWIMFLNNGGTYRPFNKPSKKVYDNYNNARCAILHTPWIQDLIKQKLGI